MNETVTEQPELSIVIAALGPYETVRDAIKQLERAKVKDRLEILFVVRNASFFDLEKSDLQCFHSFHLIELPELRTSGQARAAGIAKARSSLIAFVEEHTVPEPDWAEAMIEAHKKPCAATAPVLINANPGTMISWAEFFLDFGPYIAPASGGFVNGLPWHNTSYKKKILESYGTWLADVMEAEVWIHWDLLAKGHQLYLEPKAKTKHLNQSQLVPYIGSCFYGGWLFGGKRAKYWKWSALRRLFYAGGAIFIPFVRFPRILKLIFRSGRNHELIPKIIPYLFLGLLVHAVGEGVGYALGPRSSAEKRCDYELKRRCFLTRTDPDARTCN
jgi:Glycosyl transferase family 2